MIVALTCGRSGAMGTAERPDRRQAVDIYQLDDPQRRHHVLDPGAVTGVTISGQADHLVLHEYRHELTAFVRGGGRVLVNGHVSLPFIDGLTPWRRLDFGHPDEVRPHQLGSHPVFDGVDYRDLHFRTGVPGKHSYDQLRRIGVAGFYGRGWHPRLPEGAHAITGIGPVAAVIDYSYQLGAGEVLVHGGLDLDGFSDPQDSTAALLPQLLDWLERNR